MNFNPNPELRINNQEELDKFNDVLLEFLQKKYTQNGEIVLNNNLREVDFTKITPESANLFKEIVTNFYYKDLTDARERISSFDQQRILELIEKNNSLQAKNETGDRNENVMHICAFLRNYLSTLSYAIQSSKK